MKNGVIDFNKEEDQIKNFYKEIEEDDDFFKQNDE
jgi:hypothetical protein